MLAQLLAGLASFISPFVYSYLVLNISKHTANNVLLTVLEKIVPAGLPWASIYWICGIIAIVMVVLTVFIKFPKVELSEDEKIEGVNIILKLLSDRTVIIFFLGIFAYVGTEQGISVWISKFLNTYHGIDPHTVGDYEVALFWGTMTIGGLLGLLLLKLVDVRIVLAAFIVCAITALSFALLGGTEVSLIAFPACGFFLSVMYPGIYSLGLNSVKKHHGSVAGILCTAIIGGAVVSFLVGYLGDMLGLRFGMFLNFITLLYMLYIACTAKPLVHNDTIFRKKKLNNSND